MFQGHTWDRLCDEIIESLPPHVYLTFDIDVLDPPFCPHTGTPVGGGFTVQQMLYLIKKLAYSKKIIIGFDLVEVSGAAHQMDTIIASQLLFQLCGYGLSSQY